MWSFFVTYEVNGVEHTELGKRYASEVLARHLLANFLEKMTKEQKLIESRIIFISNSK
jgi:hypothetical protein